jgi:hypothetical protein
MRQLLLTVPLFLFAACGSHHALDGHWNQAKADGTRGMTLEFDTKSADCIVHTAPDESGHHDHGEGTYSFDMTTGSLTIQMKLEGADPVEWKGTLTDGKITLSSADGKLEFAKGAAAH